MFMIISQHMTYMYTPDRGVAAMARWPPIVEPQSVLDIVHMIISKHMTYMYSR